MSIRTAVLALLLGELKLINLFRLLLLLLIFHSIKFDRDFDIARANAIVTCLSIAQQFIVYPYNIPSSIIMNRPQLIGFNMWQKSNGGKIKSRASLSYLIHFPGNDPEHS